MKSMSFASALCRQLTVVLSLNEVEQLDFRAPLSSNIPNFSGYPERPLRSAKTVFVVVRSKLWSGSRDPQKSTRLMSQPSVIMNESCAATVAEEFSLYPTLLWLLRPNQGWYSQIIFPIHPEYMSCLMLRFETWPAGESGSRVSAEMSFEFVLNPLKNAEQYERFPPGSTDEEQGLVLFEVCL